MYVNIEFRESSGRIGQIGDVHVRVPHLERGKKNGVIF
jgi:hypothetical protein